MNDNMASRPGDYIETAAELVSTYLANNRVQSDEIPALIASVHAALIALSHPSADKPVASEKLSAAQVRKSIAPDALISFEDGKPYKMLRRHLTQRGLSPAGYRTKWGLPADYPMTAPNYSAKRSALAVAIGLGVKSRDADPTDAPVEREVAPVKPKRRGRSPKVVEALAAAPETHKRTGVAKSA